MKNKTKHKNALKYLVVFMPLNKKLLGSNGSRSENANYFLLSKLRNVKELTNYSSGI